MSVTSDLIEDWIQIRSTLQRQLKTLTSHETQLDIPEGTQATTIDQITEWIAEITSLLKQYTTSPF
jgi:hypothetical protein